MLGLIVSIDIESEQGLGISLESGSATVNEIAVGASEL